MRRSWKQTEGMDPEGIIACSQRVLGEDSPVKPSSEFPTLLTHMNQTSVHGTNIISSLNLWPKQVLPCSLYYHSKNRVELLVPKISLPNDTGELNRNNFRRSQQYDIVRWSGCKNPKLLAPPEVLLLCNLNATLAIML